MPGMEKRPMYKKKEFTKKMPLKPMKIPLKPKPKMTNKKGY